MKSETKVAIAVGGGVALALIAAGVYEHFAHAATNAASPAGQMNAAIAANGLRKIDMPIYEAFQTSAGIGVDGFVGPTTVASLKSALSAEGATISPRALRADGSAYPWLPGSGCAGYDGTNAPPASQWDPTGVC